MAEKLTIPEPKAINAATPISTLPDDKEKLHATLEERIYNIVGVELLESHFITGSKKVEDDEGNGTDYVDKCENHLLLAAAYAALAEEVGAGSNRATKFHYSTPTGRTHRARQKRSGGLI